MSRRKRALMAASIVLVVGIFLSGVGLLMHGKITPIYINESGLHISEKSQIAFGMHLFGSE